MRTFSFDVTSSGRIVATASSLHRFVHHPSMYKVFDALNGARITPQYVEQSLANGVAAIHVTINNFSRINPLPALRDSLLELEACRHHYRKLQDRVRLVECFDDFARAQSEGKLAVVLGYQNVPGLDRDLRLLGLFRDLGVRVIQVAHNVRNLYGDGCAEPADAGLSALGRELIATLNELGIVIDLSHTGERTSVEAIEASTRPVTATHSNARTICDNVRNKSDGFLDALGRKGGVIGICYLPPIVRGGNVKPTHQDVASHLSHAVKRIGAAHVGIGSDFITDQPAERYQEFMRRPEVYGTWPWRFPVADPADQQAFLDSLTGLGISTDEIGGIAAGNFLRVFEEAMK